MTKKFTYEGSNKFCKSIYLLGLSVAQLGGLVFTLTVICAIYFFVDAFFITKNLDIFTDKLIFFGFGAVFFIATEILGNSLISLSQFINWWDRGSVNTKITRNVRK
jgi:hypothetical protein|nr:MAG: hypothetical protein [Caudoviricetes sp.]